MGGEQLAMSMDLLEALVDTPNHQGNKECQNSRRKKKTRSVAHLPHLL